MIAKSTQQLPQVIGDYEALERLATTYTGVVYKGRDPHTGELVAIKVAGQVIVDDPVLLARFEQEFAMIQRLEHPHLVRALQFGYEGAAPYQVLEYVEGASLGERIERRGRLPEAEAVGIITQIGQALHYVHEHGVVHRDVKPDNILMTSDGIAKLADLGLAKDRTSNNALTRASSGLGTPHFMAPEQFRDAKHADPPYDVYGLGATLYMAVTGKLPFDGRGVADIWRKKLTNDLIRPRKLVPSLSLRVEMAIRKAVDVDPGARPASCLQFIEELSGRSAARPGAGATRPSAAGALRPTPPQYRGAERRATVRYTSDKTGSCQPVSGCEGVEWAGKIKDISADGIGLVLPRRFEPGTVLLVDVSPRAEEVRHSVLVRVRRVQQLSARRWILGCVFARRLSDEEVQTLV